MSTSFIIMVMMVETRNESRDLCCVPYSHACIFIHSFCMNAWFCRCIRVGKISSTFIYKTKRFRQSSWHNCDAWFLQWVKRMALTETNIFVPQKWMVGVLWSNIVFFWGAILGSCHVSYAPMAGLPGGVQKTPRWLANPCTVDVWRHRWISCPRCVLSLTCDWTACFFSDLHLRRWSFAPFSYMLGELTWDNPPKNWGGIK